MNNTKWNEIFKAFFNFTYNDETKSYEYKEGAIDYIVPFQTKSINGYISEWDVSWEHFGSVPTEYQSIEWLKIKLTIENKNYVLSSLSKIHVPGKIENEIVIIYGNSHEFTDYLSYSAK